MDAAGRRRPTLRGRPFAPHSAAARPSLFGGRLRAWLPLLLALLIFCSLAAYQLDLPGLHYDEAKEAGLNAMQLVRGQPVTLFRNAGLHLFGLTLPNVRLHRRAQRLPGATVSGLGGAGVFALRALPIACAGLTLIFLSVRRGRVQPAHSPAWPSCCWPSILRSSSGAGKAFSSPTSL
ncbi:hypothetical protein [Candidatus Amarolinea dominans]|uniref:hypothetical protein n=1 Tax=Candidatus Amarolinea dominans TaxID=3140696 RepID=UPI0031CC63EF